MTRTLLQLVLRHAEASAADGPDADLLRRFAATGDGAAFAAVVRRHGPMVWAVCRRLVPNRVDAEDAFQAVFFALAQSAKAVRKPEQLGGWLHGAAMRIANRAKRSHARRVSHERTTAKGDGESPVAAGAWEAMLAAVHEEVDRLPKSLRAAFVACDLQGLDPADAAARLGVKANTLSGQLARARQRVLDALARKGLGAAAVLAVGTAAAVPEALANAAINTVTNTGAAGAVPAAVAALASEVTAMKATTFKLLAAGVLLACGLATGLGSAWLATANGQYVPPGAPPKAAPLDPGLFSGPFSSKPPDTGSGQPWAGSGPTPPNAGLPPRAEYLYAAKPDSLVGVKRLLDDKARQHWELAATLDVDSVDLQKATPEDKKAFEGIVETTRKVLVFKRTGTVPPGELSGVRPGGSGYTGFAPGGSPVPGPGGSPTPGGGSSWTLPSGWGTREGGWGETSTKVTKPGLTALLDPLFARLDKNGDGKLTADEMPEALKGTFKLYDKDNDGAIGRTEFAAYLPVALGADPGSVPGIAGSVGTGAAPAKPGEVYEVFALKNAKAEEVAKALGEVFNGPTGKGTGRVAVVADKESNSIVVTRASVLDLETIRTLLKTAMDAAPPAAKPGGAGLGGSGPGR